MDRRLHELIFPEGAKSIYVNGKTYTYEEFHKAKQLELKRGKSGRFVSKAIRN